MASIVNGHRSPVFGGSHGPIGSTPTTPGRMAAPRGIPHMGSPGQGQPPGMVPVGTPPYRNPAMPMTSQAAGNELYFW